MKKSIACILLFALVFSACQREDPEMSLSIGQANILAEGGSVSVTVTCNYKWTAQADPWITVSPASGDRGDTAVKLTVDANTGSSIRKGSVTFSCSGLSRAVALTQSQPLNQRLTITHNLNRFTVPLLLGNGLSARVDFGEGSKQDYASGLSWTYSTGGTHKVVIECAGGTSFTLESVAGVSAVDMSAF